MTGDGELFTWGDSTYGKTHRCDLRTTFVPWKMEESDESTTTTSSVKFHLTSKFVTQVSVGAHHSLGLFRIRELSKLLDCWPLINLSVLTTLLAFVSMSMS